MYTVRIKRQKELPDKRKIWEGVSVEELKGITLLDYLKNEDKPTIAALFNNESEMIAIVTNELFLVEQYKEKCLAIMVNDLATLILPEGSKIELAASVFPDGRVKEISTLE